MTFIEHDTFCDLLLTLEKVRTHSKTLNGHAQRTTHPKVPTRGTWCPEPNSFSSVCVCRRTVHQLEFVISEMGAKTGPPFSPSESLCCCGLPVRREELLKCDDGARCKDAQPPLHAAVLSSIMCRFQARCQHSIALVSLHCKSRDVNSAFSSLLEISPRVLCSTQRLVEFEVHDGESVVCGPNVSLMDWLSRSDGAVLDEVCHIHSVQQKQTLCTCLQTCSWCRSECVRPRVCPVR